jgi:Carbohydrate binding module (family 6)
MKQISCLFFVAIALATFLGSGHAAGQQPKGVGATLPFTEYEAEAGTLGGGAAVVNLPLPVTSYNPFNLEASGHAYIALTGTGQYVQWTNNTGKSITALNVRVCIPDAPTGYGITSTIDLYVNGTLRQAVPVSSQQTWQYDEGNDTDPGNKNPSAGNPYEVWDEYPFFVTGATIAPGSTIRIQKDAANSASFYYIDLIDLETPPAALTQPANSISIASSPYNAVANNSSVDNSTTIQNCINDAQSSGKIVWIPSGTFWIAKPISATGITVEGAGIWYSTIFFNSAVGGPNWGILGTSCTYQNFAVNSNTYGYANGDSAFGMGGNNWVLNNLWITHMGVGTWDAGNGGTIENTRITNTWADGINLNNFSYGSTTGSNETVTNNFLRGDFADAIAFGGKDDSQYTPCTGFTITNNTVMTGPLHPYGGRNILIQNNYVHDQTAYPGLWIGNFNQDGSMLDTVVGGNVVVRCGGNNFGSEAPGIQVGTEDTTYVDSDGATIPYVDDGIIVRSNVITDSLFSGLQVNNCSNLLVEGNTIVNSQTEAIDVTAGWTGNGTFVDNLISNMNSSWSDVFDDAVSLSSNFDANPISQINIADGTVYVTQEPANTFLSQLSDDLAPIQASSYNSESNVGTQACSEGGLNVDGISNGSYTVYNNVNLNGATTFSARVASATSGGTINIHLGSATGTVIGTCTVPSTNGAQTWTTVSCPVTGASGYQNVYLVYNGGSGNLFNVEWFGFLKSANTIEASSYNSESNVQTESNSEGGLDVGYISNGSFTEYNNVDLNNITAFTARVASPSGGSTISVYLDSPTGTPVGTLTVPATGGWQTWTTLSCNLALGVTGYHNVYLVYTSGMNIKSFSFDGGLNGTEASSYASESNVGTQSCSEGGLNVEGITNGSYTVYNNVNLNGATTFSARVASATSGGTIDICLDSPTGTVIGTCPVTSTGGWQTWTTVSCNLSGASGWHNIYLVNTGGGGYLYNVEWFAFQGSNNYTAAASYNSLSGSLYLQGDSEGGQNLAGISNGNYAVYNGVNLTAAGSTGFQARVASAGVGGSIAIHLDSATGTLIGTCTVPVTGGWQNWTTQSCALNSSATGVHNIYLVFTGGSGTLFNVEGFEFQSDFSPIAAASYNVSLSTSSLGLQGCSEGGQNLENINTGNYAVYNNIDLTGATTFTARTASPGSGGTIVIHLDSPTGTVIGTCTTPGTGNWQVYANSSCTLSGASGTHNIYLVFTTGGINLEWFEF